MIEQAVLFPERVTLCLPEHLNDLKHTIHVQYGEVVSIEDQAPSWKRVRWREGQDPHQPRRMPQLPPIEADE